MTRSVLAASLLSSVLAVACATPSPPPSQAPTGEAPAGEPPAGGAAMGCELEIALECGPGRVDGCLRRGADGPLTTRHVCVPESETEGPPCTNEIAKVCPEGLVDACLLSPAPAETHVCVAR